MPFGITPAYAGITQTFQYIRLILLDHPRIRGDYHRLRHLLLQLLGSPPHTRRLLGYSEDHDYLFRITPAYAGITIYLWPVGYRLKDHPRIRGDYGTLGEQEEVEQGSPPHTRGLLSCHEFHLGEAGITPAYAGITMVGRP